MSNGFFDQTISLKTIIIVGGFWLTLITMAIIYLFGGIKEGFKAGLIGIGSALDYKMGEGVKTSWENKTNDVNDVNDVNDNIYASLEQNVGGPIPLPEEELLFFDKNKFSPDCCPANYSNADGCVCASPEQMKYLNERGGNRTLTGEY
jgi:hypothetical protein